MGAYTREDQAWGAPVKCRGSNGAGCPFLSNQSEPEPVPEIHCAQCNNTGVSSYTDRIWLVTRINKDSKEAELKHKVPQGRDVSKTLRLDAEAWKHFEHDDHSWRRRLAGWKPSHDIPR